MYFDLLIALTGTRQKDARVYIHHNLLLINDEEW